MRLYIVRHGIAVDVGEQGVGTDKARMLSARGRRRTRGVARALRIMGWSPERIITSPLARARETADILSVSACPHIPVAASKTLGFDMSAGKVIELLSKLPDTDAAVVGHMPGLSDLASVLLCGSRGLHVPFKKAGVCCVKFPHRVAAGEGLLEWMLGPKQLVLLASRHEGR